MTGRMMNERLGKWSFWVMFLGFNVGFFPMHILGCWECRGAFTPIRPDWAWNGLNMVMTIGAFVLGIGILISIINLSSVCVPAS